MWIVGQENPVNIVLNADHEQEDVIERSVGTSGNRRHTKEDGDKIVDVVIIIRTVLIIIT